MSNYIKLKKIKIEIHTIQVNKKLFFNLNGRNFQFYHFSYNIIKIKSLIICQNYQNMSKITKNYI